VPASEVPAAAIEKAAATSEPTLRSAVSAEPTGAVVTATVAPVITPANGIAIVTMLLVASPPGIVNVMVVGASIAVDIFAPILNWVQKKVYMRQFDLNRTAQKICLYLTFFIFGFGVLL
jgi:hypothetical protein